jgi:ribosomal protein S11
VLLEAENKSKAKEYAKTAGRGAAIGLAFSPVDKVIGDYASTTLRNFKSARKKGLSFEDAASRAGKVARRRTIKSLKKPRKFIPTGKEAATSALATAGLSVGLKALSDVRKARKKAKES